MRLRVDEIAFSGPSKMEDATNYTFAGADPREEFSVEFELPVGAATPAAEALADTRGQMADYLQSDFGVDEEGELPSLAGKPAPYMRYHFVDRGETKQGFMAVANLGSEAADGDWVKLNWLLDLPADQVRARVDPVIASFAKAGDPAPGPTPSGWVRRQAGPWEFDLPSGHSYPRSYAWLDPDAELRLQITVHPYDVDKPDLEARVAAVQDRGRALLDREDVPIIHGQLVRLRLRDGLDEEWFACRVVQSYEIGNPVRIRHVEVAADGPLAQEQRLRRMVDALLASVRVEERR
ncbi:MAG: hypothetical protein R6X02_15255 [Enhygromyxa sp.]